MITAETRVAGVFGFPVEHSLSPQMHNAALQAAGLPCVYAAFHVTPEDLEPALYGARAMGFAGLNLTIPHKVPAVELMDELATEAELLGAVNTVQFDGRRMIGYNTDVEGFSAAVKQAGADLSGVRTVVYGAGGAARAVVYAALRAGGQVTVVNRTAQRAEELVEWVGSSLLRPGHLTVAVPGSPEEITALEDAAVVVNATSAGMTPREGSMPPVRLASLRATMLVVDLVYRPPETKFLAEARRAGCRTMNGVPMLVHQGAASYRIWFQEEPDVNAMAAAVEAALSAGNGA